MDAPGVKTFFTTLWAMIGLAIVAGYYASTLLGAPRLHPNEYPFNSAIYLLWVPLVPLLVRLARSYAPVRARRLRVLLIHAGCALSIILVKHQLHRVIFCTGFDCCYWQCVLGIRFEAWFAHWLMNESYVYASTIAGIWAFDAMHRSHRRALALADKERELAAAELSSAEGRIAPHEVTTMLASIARKVHGDPYGAEQMITRVADQLRLAVQSMRRSDS